MIKKNHALFKGRNAVLITNHQKEQVIFPVLKPLGMKLSVLDSIDTDQFGSFTRDIPRAGTQLEAAQLKVKRALEISGGSIGLSSEGSFGPHPDLLFVAVNAELVLYVDTMHNIEISGWEVSTETNFSNAEVSSIEEAIRFSSNCGFPSHGIVVRPNHYEDGSLLFKGITDEGILIDAVEKCLTVSFDGKAMIETDMRAMCNSTRMKVIEKATINLFQKLNSLCPVCDWPGFEITDWVKGLLCENCFKPTRLTFSHIYTCKKCSHKNKIDYPEGKLYCEARYCDFCNP